MQSGFRPAGEPRVFSPNRIRSSVLGNRLVLFRIRNNVFTHKRSVCEFQTLLFLSFFLSFFFCCPTRLCCVYVNVREYTRILRNSLKKKTLSVDSKNFQYINYPPYLFTQLRTISSKSFILFPNPSRLNQTIQRTHHRPERN